MQVLALDHVNIRTADVPQTIRFFTEVLGMEARFSPGRTDMADGAWICDAHARAIIHVAASRIPYPWEAEPPPAGALGSGRVHHVALRCQGYQIMNARLSELRVSFRRNDIPEVGLRQMFLDDPNGITLELNFFGD